MEKIAIVVPTCRQEKYEKFLEAWRDLFAKHRVHLYKVTDGEQPTVQGFRFYTDRPEYEEPFGYTSEFSVKDIMGEYSDLIYNKNDGVRNLGFAMAYKDGADIIITLDDDVEPLEDEDPIQDHLDVLNTRKPISWVNTVEGSIYMRGFPYGIRQEAEVVLSHGAWQGVADFDAATQLVYGTPPVRPVMMPIPKGIMFPMCIMNVAFKRKMTPYMYQAPMFGDINRFADIWAGIEAKKVIDEKGWCAVTGYALVQHNRASDPFVNLVKEANGVGMNEKYGEDEYFKLYESNRKRWQKFLEELS